jgi:aspartokinase-like uncharacterized kinase
MWVVKLGGSLACAPQLASWLDVLSRDAPVVLVPGGGPFADQVRAMQRRWGFHEAAAHRMALLAMEQYGRMLCALQPRLRPAAGPGEIQDALASGEIPVWMPSRMVLRDPDIEQSWAVTSDSLAAWLCTRVPARALLLVKSAALKAGRWEPRALADQGLVDPAFPDYARIAGVPVWAASADDHGDVVAMVSAKT